MSARSDLVSGAGKPGLGVTIAKNSFWLFADSIVGMAASFYCSIVVARHLGPDRMGEYNYFLWFAVVLKMVTDLAITATVRKFASELMGRGDGDTVKTLVRAAFRLQTKLVVVGTAVGIALVFASFPLEHRLLGILAVLTIIPGVFMGVPAGALYATENLSYNAVSSVSAIAVNLIGVTTSVLLGWGLVGLVASTLASRSVDCVLRFMLFRWRYANVPGTARRTLDPALLKRMTSFGMLQIILILLYALLFDRMEVFFLKALAPAREIAFFSISFTLAQYLLIIPNTLSGAASVSMMVKQGRSPRESAEIAAATTWFTTLVAAPVLVGVAALSDPLLRLAYGANYLPAIPVLTALSLFALSLAASQPAQYLLVSAERQVFYILCLISAALIDVAGNMLLIPSFGSLGAAYAKGISQALAGVGFITYMVRKFDVTLPFSRIARLMAVVVAMFFAVRLVTAPLAPLAALAVGIPVGAVVFISLMRWLRCLDATDRDRLRRFDKLLPASTHRAYFTMLDFVAPVRPRGE